VSNADWWANKLAQTQAQAPVGRPTGLPPMPPSQQPMQAMPSFQPISSQAPQAPAAQSAQQTSRCPECGSGNYMAVANAAPRCYDCGYPISQSGSRYGSLTGAHVEGATKSATGNDVSNNWSPVPPGYSADGRKL
jgi:ribosomal protein S27AE